MPTAFKPGQVLWRDGQSWEVVGIVHPTDTSGSSVSYKMRGPDGTVEVVPEIWAIDNLGLDKNYMPGPWTIEKTTLAPAGGTPLYHLVSPSGAKRVVRHNNLSKYQLAQGNVPASTSMGKDWEHHKHNIDDAADDKICPQCGISNDSSSKSCFNCGAKFTRGTGGTSSMDAGDPKRKQYIEQMKNRIKDEPWLKDYMPSDVQRAVPAAPTVDNKPAKPIIPQTLPELSEAELRERRERRRQEQTPMDDSTTVNVPGTTTLTDEATEPLTRQVWRPEPPLFNKKLSPEMQKIVERETRPQRNVTNPAHRTSLPEKPKPLPTKQPETISTGDLHWSITPDNILIAPGVGRGMYMIKPNVGHGVQNNVGLYYKNRGVSPIEEMGIFPDSKSAVATALQHFKQQQNAHSKVETSRQQQRLVDQDHDQADHINWRKDIEERENKKKGMATALNWDEITPGEEWMAPSNSGLRYVINMENGQYVLAETHRRWSSNGPTLGAHDTLEHAMQAAEADFTQRDQADQHTVEASSVTPEMVLNEVKLMREAEIPELDIKRMVEEYYPEVAAQVLKQAQAEALQPCRECGGVEFGPGPRGYLRCVHCGRSTQSPQDELLDDRLQQVKDGPRLDGKPGVEEQLLSGPRESLELDMQRPMPSLLKNTANKVGR